MTPIFVRTETKTIEITKINYIDLQSDTGIIHFASGRSLRLSEQDTRELGEAMRALSGKSIVAHSAQRTP